ncbi:metallophosphoesterase [Paraburkholderia dilworthii]|uniref:metallophosphoesterase n=1 Tax=Paraburkholderia dilworthii TaxID=948106 RepID=UPI00047FE3C0
MSCARAVRIQVASDFHMESRKGAVATQFLTYANAELLVLAGDMGKPSEICAQFATWPCPVVYIRGNHEYRWKSERRETSGAPVKWINGNVVMLENGAVFINHILVLGCCLWTDYNLLGQQEHAMHLADNGNDSHIFRRQESLLNFFSPAQVLLRHNSSLKWLSDQLSEPSRSSKLVITHYAPHRRSLTCNRHLNNFDAAFGSDLHARVRQANLWVHGHLHRSMDYRVLKCRVVCNPLGGATHPNRYFEKAKTVVIDGVI